MDASVTRNNRSLLFGRLVARLGLHAALVLGYLLAGVALQQHLIGGQKEHVEGGTLALRHLAKLCHQFGWDGQRQ